MSQHHPREREDEQEDHDEPPQRHPPCGVEAHEIAAAARLRANVVPTPSAVTDGFDLVFPVRTGDVVLFGGPGIPALALRGLLRVKHGEASGTPLGPRWRRVPAPPWRRNGRPCRPR